MSTNYSKDFHIKVVTTYLKGTEAAPKVAKRFGVSVASIRNWTRKYKHTISGTPKQYTGGMAPTHVPGTLPLTPFVTALLRRGLESTQKDLDALTTVTAGEAHETFGA